MNCPTCGNPMERLGNLSGVTLTSLPPQEDITYICRADRVKVVRRERQASPPQPAIPADLDEYTTVKS